MTLDPELQRIFDRKEERRKELAKLSFPEKIEIVKQLNELADAKRTGKIRFRFPLRTATDKS